MCSLLGASPNFDLLQIYQEEGDGPQLLAYVAAQNLVFSSYTTLDQPAQQKGPQQLQARRYSPQPGSSHSQPQQQQPSQDLQAKQQRQQKAMQGHHHAITCMAVSADHSLIATADAATSSSQLILWDRARQLPLCSAGQLHAAGIAAMALSDDGSQIATIGLLGSGTSSCLRQKVKINALQSCEAFQEASKVQHVHPWPGRMLHLAQAVPLVMPYLL